MKGHQNIHQVKAKVKVKNFQIILYSVFMVKLQIIRFMLVELQMIIKIMAELQIVQCFNFMAVNQTLSFVVVLLQIIQCFNFVMVEIQIIQCFNFIMAEIQIILLVGLELLDSRINFLQVNLYRQNQGLVKLNQLHLHQRVRKINFKIIHQKLLLLSIAISKFMLQIVHYLMQALKMHQRVLLLLEVLIMQIQIVRQLIAEVMLQNFKIILQKVHHLMQVFMSHQINFHLHLQQLYLQIQIN